MPLFKQFEHKYKDQVVEYFPENAGDLLFNKAPVIKESSGVKKVKKVKKQSVFQDKDEDSLDLIEKKVKTDQNIFEDEDTFFSKVN